MPIDLDVAPATLPSLGIREPQKPAAADSGGIVSENALNLGFSPPAGSAEERLTCEDVLRARDRLKILKTRAAKSSLRLEKWW